jgi:hypothetical protein
MVAGYGLRVVNFPASSGPLSHPMTSAPSVLLQEGSTLDVDSMQTLSHSLPHLSALNLAFCTGVHDQQLRHLSRCTTLTQLSLRSFTDFCTHSLTHQGRSLALTTTENLCVTVLSR